MTAACKPLMAIPIKAVEKVEKNTLEIKLKKGDKKGEAYMQNTFAIFMKDDFLDLFLRPDYEMLFNPDTKRRN